MREALLNGAPWLAAACALVATIVVASTAWTAWQRWRELGVVRRAAAALVDVHAERLEASVQEASRATGKLAEGGEQLADSLAELRADAEHVRWLATRVGDERERLVRELVDAVLPSSRRSGGDDG